MLTQYSCAGHFIWAFSVAKGVDLKNSHNLKVMFYSGGEFLGLQETAPQVTPRELLQGEWGRSQVI